MTDFMWDKIPSLITPRLHLRALTPHDRHDLLAMYGDPEVMCYTSDLPFPDLTFVDQLLDSVATLFQQRESLEWGITLTTGSQVIGTCGLHSFNKRRNTAEVGCILHRAYWGQSLMRAALEIVIEFGFTRLRLDRLHADIDAPNSRSIRLFQRLGFRSECAESTIYTRHKPS